jgi:uncharacterized protein YndB with AHSA1/START domain
VSEVRAGILIDVPPAAAWELFFDQERWPSWSDGFGRVIANDGYPRAGGTLRWRSSPAGRGEVTETVVEHLPGRLHRVSFVDPQAEGGLTTSFQPKAGGTLVEQRLSYRLRGGGLFGGVSDLLFIRTQQRRSLERSLFGLKQEAEGLALAAD